jgi:uncharacterized membrane protein
MDVLNPILLMLHFLGLAMGLAVSFSSMVMQGLMSTAAPQERPVLARFAPRMSIVGHVGLGLLWGTGVALMFTKWDLEVLPWQFRVKLGAVVLLTIAVGYITRLMKQAQRGDQAAVARIPAVGKAAFLLALTAVVFAVLTFD